MLLVISGQKEEFFVRLINKLIEGGEGFSAEQVPYTVSEQQR